MCIMIFGVLFQIEVTGGVLIIILYGSDLFSPSKCHETLLVGRSCLGFNSSFNSFLIPDF